MFLDYFCWISHHITSQDRISFPKQVILGPVEIIYQLTKLFSKMIFSVIHQKCHNIFFFFFCEAHHLLYDVKFWHITSMNFWLLSNITWGFALSLSFPLYFFFYVKQIYITHCDYNSRPKSTYQVCRNLCVLLVSAQHIVIDGPKMCVTQQINK